MSIRLRPYIRKEERVDVRLSGQLKYVKTTIPCRVLNLSEAGMGLRLAGPRRLSPGLAVEFHGPELGHLHATIAWAHNGAVGLKFNHTSSSYAQIKSYFRFHHRQPQQVFQV